MKQGDILFKKFIEILVNSEIKQRTLNYLRIGYLSLPNIFQQSVNKSVGERQWIGSMNMS